MIDPGVIGAIMLALLIIAFIASALDWPKDDE